MAGRLNTLTARLILVLLLLQAVLLPLLYVGLNATVSRNVMDVFVDDARLHGRVLADGIEAMEWTTDEDEILALLDSSLLGGLTVYATFETDDGLLVSSLMDADDVPAFVEDFEFHQHDDDVYFIAIPVHGSSGVATLRLGFDETHIQQSLEDTRNSMVAMFTLYVAAALVVAGYLGWTIVRPIKQLQAVSRRIAAGEVGESLATDSGMNEITDLAGALETMRRNFVEANEQLQLEISEKEMMQAEQAVLEERLRHAERLESLGTLAGGVAHEFNNVLQPLLLYTDLALEDLPEGSPTIYNLNRVMDLAKRARHLSQQILVFGRRENGIEPQVLSLGPVVDEAVTMIRALLPATVDIRSEIGSNLGPVRCDPMQIQQLVINLCNNAFRALVDHKGFIGVSVVEVVVPKKLAKEHPNLRPGEYIVLQVADTGSGMDSKTIERAFEPFFTTRDVGDGTGLGLSVVHGIVMRHGGEILIDSTPGKGTRVRVYLPVANAEENPQPSMEEVYGEDTGN